MPSYIHFNKGVKESYPRFKYLGDIRDIRITRDCLKVRGERIEKEKIEV